MDVDKFVDIKRQDPVSVFDLLPLCCGLERRELDTRLLIGAIIADMCKPAGLRQMVQYGIGPVSAII